MQSCGVFKFTKHKKGVKCVFSFCFTSNSIVNSNISKNTSKKHEEDAFKVKKDSEKVMTHFCVLFFAKNFCVGDTEEKKTSYSF